MTLPTVAQRLTRDRLAARRNDKKVSGHSEKGKVDEKKNEQDGTPSTVKRRITAYTRRSADKSQPTSFSERGQ